MILTNGLNTQDAELAQVASHASIATAMEQQDALGDITQKFVAKIDAVAARAAQRLDM